MSVWRFWCKLESGPNVDRALLQLCGQKSSCKCRVPQFRQSRYPNPELARLELALLDLLRQLDSANGDCRVVESLEPQHRPNPLFHSPVILFDQVVQVLARSDLHCLGEFPAAFISRTARCDAA